MNIVNQITRLVQARSTANPKTPLGFYAATIVSLLTAGVTVSCVLAVNNVLIGLIPIILGSAGCLAILVAAGVFFINYKRPQNLTLGQITGREFAAIERVTLGDSRQGERIVVTGAVEPPTNSQAERVSARLDSPTSKDE